MHPCPCRCVPKSVRVDSVAVRLVQWPWRQVAWYVWDNFDRVVGWISPDDGTIRCRDVDWSIRLGHTERPMKLKEGLERQ